MDKGIYTALSGGLAKAHELELIANNLANTNTAGFKRDTGTFSEYLMELRRPDSAGTLEREIKAITLWEGRPTGDKSFVEMDGIYTDFSQGAIARSGRNLDVAINGKGFFEVLTPAGVRYTRQGNFSLSPTGQLITVNGYPVLSKGGALAENRTIQLDRGRIHIDGEGGIYQNGVKMADIKIQEFRDPQWLEKIGNAYFTNKNPANIKATVDDTNLMQGFMEGSNVNPVREMTKLVQATRAYESHMQAIKTYQQIDTRSVNDIAKTY